MTQQHKPRQLQDRASHKRPEQVQPNRDRFMMDDIVGDHPGSWVMQISQHADIGQKEQDEIKPPGKSEARKQIDGEQENKQFFEFEQVFHVSSTELFTNPEFP